MNDVLTDPCCCECSGPLTVVERDTAFLSVVCAQCGNSHGIELATAPDGTFVYWPAFRMSLKD